MLSWHDVPAGDHAQQPPRHVGGVPVRGKLVQMLHCHVRGLGEDLRSMHTMSTAKHKDYWSQRLQSCMALLASSMCYLFALAEYLLEITVITNRDMLMSEMIGSG